MNTANDRAEALSSYLQALKLPAMRESYEQEAEDAQKLGASYETFLYNLSKAEVLGRETRSIQTRIKQAQFPHLKTLDSFDFASLPHLDKKRVVALITGDYLAKAENILSLGNSGTGKTHLAISLGIAACQNGSYDQILCMRV